MKWTLIFVLGKFKRHGTFYSLDQFESDYNAGMAEAFKFCLNTMPALLMNQQLEDEKESGPADKIYKVWKERVKDCYKELHEGLQILHCV